MSDFLANLVGRSLGVLEVARPRVPSLYEPYRRGGGLLGAHPDARLLDAHPQPAIETAEEGDPNAGPISHRTQDVATRRSAPIRHAQTEPVAETSSRGDVRAAPGNDATRDLRTHRARLTAREGLSAENEAAAKLAAGFEPPDSAGAARSPLTSRIAPSHEPMAPIEFQSRHESTRQLNPSPVLRPTSVQSGPTAAGARTDGMAFIAAPPSGGRGTEDQCSLLASGSLLEQGLAATETPDSSLRLRQSTEPRISVEPPNLAQPSSPTTAVVGPPAWPSLQARPLPPVTDAARPPLASRSGGVRNPEALPRSSPPPGVHISIGRVEVKAVFPEPSVRRSPPARSRPAVSLDDYLNQRHRGRR